MRLDKFLADMGVGSRSDLKKDIRGGKVVIDGKMIKDPGFAVPEGAQVLYKGQKVAYEEFVYYMLNKPAGAISASEDPKQKTVIDLLDERKRKDLFPVGRLDKDTEGLLLITNDGELAHQLLSPKKHVDKVYYARIEGRVTEEDVEKFRAGLQIGEDFTAMPAQLEILASGDTSEIKVTIQEGKFHQVKRMFHAVGKEVVYLKRLSMGTLLLDESLAPGAYRRLTDEELAGLKGHWGDR
ncbi:MAG: rRNA pseudouridine synthase [Firmicutes bacterium]|nr:rRNA pseudouridine synthase [Bacillota bacterium]